MPSIPYIPNIPECQHYEQSTGSRDWPGILAIIHLLILVQWITTKFGDELRRADFVVTDVVTQRLIFAKIHNKSPSCAIITASDQLPMLTK